ncbi:uncharacterized protein Osi17 [Chelonus insularis]|uniref:uncharacterized protein Osi17 n=1 Tax=Chelonus insularis TaxID=460826 RepID=UPI00158BD380|nr:uncharacterized protein LOC118073504 [Chelonus insularis]
MFLRILLIFILTVTLGNAHFFSFSNLASYAKYFYMGNSTTKLENELWSGIVRDCSRKISFSCIQKNAYSYLDGTFDARDNITVFDGLVLRRNNLNYDSCTKDCQNVELEENLVDNSSREPESRSQKSTENTENSYEEPQSPLEEVTSALREKAVKFLATRDYEIQLPEFFFEGSKIKISPREIDEDGALIRIDFGQRAVENQGRIFFKKIRKFIQNRLLMSFLALILIIKLIKIKFMFILPFLFGVGTAKKIFLKILLFFIPAFAHIFKLCSSYYNDHVKYYHHHHHRVAHHHHHVPVPVPVPAPAFYDSHHHEPHPPIFEEEFQGYDYAHPHIQLRKDMEELKEWGIDTMLHGQDDPGIKINGFQSPTYTPPTYQGVQHPVINIKSNPTIDGIPAPINIPSHAQSLAYSGYLDDRKLNRRVSVQNPSTSVPQASHPQAPVPAVQINPQAIKQPTVVSNQIKPQSSVYSVFSQPTNVQTQRTSHQVTQKSSSTQEVNQSTNQVVHDDAFYGPILQRLDDIFFQLKFVEENCKERLICSMYKNPTLYSPHSNLVSNELSRDVQELKRKVTGSASSQRFYRYFNAARLGQDGGNCQQSYPCQTNTE